MAELRVAVGMILSFLHLAIALKAVELLSQDLGDLFMADRMLLLRQFHGQGSSALADPA
jgi:hypothetical protein